MPKWSGIMLLVLITGCTDKAAPDYAACMQEQGKDEALAVQSCRKAVAADPSSPAGRAAELLVKIVAGEKAADAERARLLSSADPNDWATLIAKYPDSKEAGGAKQKERRAASVCADLDVYMSQLTTGAAGVVAVMPEVRTLNRRLPSNAGTLAILKNFSAVGKQSEGEAAKYQQALDGLHRHAVAPGEQPVVDGLAQGFGTLVTAFSKYAEVLRGRNGTNPLDASDLEPITSSVPKATEELIANMRAKCSGGDGVTAQQSVAAP